MLDSAILAATLTDRPSRALTRPASSAAAIPPSLISLSETPPAPQRACASTSRRTRRSEEHTSELQSRSDLVCRLLLEKKKKEKTAAGRPHPHRVHARA